MLDAHEPGNKRLGSIRDREYFALQGGCQLWKEDSDPCFQVVCVQGARSDHTEEWIDVFCFSGSGGRPDFTGGYALLVGAVFQKTGKLQPFKK